MKFNVSKRGTNVLLSVEANRYTVGPDVVTFYADGFIDGAAAEVVVAMFPKDVTVYSDGVYAADQLRAPMYNSTPY